METLVQDIRYGLRVLRKSPGFTAVAVLTLALGIGANTVTFSSINGMLLRPFLFPQLDRVMSIWETAPQQNIERASAAAANFRDWQEQSHSFQNLAALHGWNANMTGSGTPERVEGYQVTADFFRLLGMPSELGRALAAEDFKPGHLPVVVLSHGFWEQRLGANRALVGKTLEFDGQARTVVGIMPRDFDFPTGAQAWAPLILSGAEAADRNHHFLLVLGRLRPAVTQAQAEHDLAAIAAREGREFPQSNAGHSVRVIGMVEDLTQGSRQFLLVLLGAAAFVLLLACANVANLQLARATGRAREVALRSALGASRTRVIQQLLAESLLLAALGAAAGLLLSSWWLPLLMRGVPPFIIEHVPGLKHIQLDYRVLAFTLLLGGLVGVLTGLVPALQVSRPDLNEALKEGARGGSSAPGRHRLRSLLVVSEVALAIVLLVGAGLMVKGFRALMERAQGFDRQGILTFRVTLPAAKYSSPAQVGDFYRQLVERIQALPSVESAAAASSLPSDWNGNQTWVTIEGQAPPAPGEMRLAASQVISPDFFRTLRIPLHQGRVFTLQDGANAPAVVIISQSFARRFLGSEDSLGKRVRLGDDRKQPWRTVVGVVGDILRSSFDRQPDPTAYVPLKQVPQEAMAVALRTGGNPLAMAAAARAQVQALDRDQPVYDMRTLEQIVSDDNSGVESSARLMTTFGFIALALAAAGIYAVMAYLVAQRTHEIGVRLALGARPRDVQRLILTNAAVLAALGLAIGISVATAMARLLSSSLFGVVSVDLAVFVGCTAVLALAAALAGYVPARRAAKVDPMVALRYE
ncbi:MAG TPA: ABC transporter permease [Terriglobales bacterium]